jgi:hypothetical protein
MRKAIYFSTQWPKEKYSAACERVFGLVHFLNKNHYGVDFVSCSKIVKVFLFIC